MKNIKLMNKIAAVGTDIFDRSLYNVADDVANADAIMVLEQGEIIERGSHDDLLAQKGRYYELYTGLKELD